jgi:hypothetical protein
VQRKAENYLVSETDRSFVPDLAGMEVTVKLDTAQKRASKEVSVSVDTICKEDLTDVYGKGTTR